MLVGLGAHGAVDRAATTEPEGRGGLLSIFAAALKLTQRRGGNHGSPGPGNSPVTPHAAGSGAAGVGPASAKVRALERSQGPTGRLEPVVLNMLTTHRGEGQAW